MELIIAEKPSAAEKIAYALGPATRKRIGKVSYFEISVPKQVAVVPAVGHLFTLKERTRGIPSFDIEWFPTHEVNPKAHYMRQYLEAIKTLAQHAERLIIATDYDLEGDLIGANIARFLGKLDSAKRMRFSTLTPSEIRASYENLEEVNRLNVSASETRHIVDWIYGINLSRAAMNAIGKAGRKKVLSIGRVQGPMLKFLAERQREIEAFVPKKFWELYAIARGARFQHETKQFFSKDEAEKKRNKTPQKGILKVATELRSHIPLPPFDFTTLQTEAYRLFGFTPIHTESVAQTLYTNALISYPRTASQKLPSQLNLPSIIAKLAENPAYSKLTNSLIAAGRLKPRQGKKEDVHPAIFPTGITGKMGADEAKLYDLIVRRFLACFAEPAETEDTSVELVAGEERYLASGRKLTRQGWVEYYPFKVLTERPLPHFKDGETVELGGFEILEKETTPSPRFTPATIIKFMEDHELGTKTTRAIILDTLYKRGYVTGRQIAVTPLGLAIYDIFRKYSPKVVDPELTRKLEREMEGIQNATISKEQVIAETKEIVTDVIKDISAAEEEIGKELLEKLRETEAFAPCRCGGTLRVLQKGGSKFLGCTNYPVCRQIYSLPSTLFSYASSCGACGAPKIWMIKKRQRFTVCLNRECHAKLKGEPRKAEEEEIEGEGIEREKEGAGKERREEKNTKRIKEKKKEKKEEKKEREVDEKKEEKKKKKLGKVKKRVKQGERRKERSKEE